MWCCKREHEERKTPETNSLNTSILVAAIDFGTTYSGWAFSFRHEHNADPTNISSRQWIGGQHVSLKAPTAVLVQPDGRTLQAFGYEAETKYADLASQKNSSEYKKWYFFRRFKMMLYGEITFGKHFHLVDETKKHLPAKTVFSLVIKYLKEDMLKTSTDRLASGLIKEDEITWVLTVPAIWNDAAKQFMRQAAVEAGIRSENLRIALEPEAASIFCRLLPVEKMMDGIGMASLKTGSKYVVLDAGGGTVDITVHEVMPDGKLNEVHAASGGAWGGTKVDEAYEQFLVDIVGNTVFQRFRNESKEDYIDMFREFEIKKRDVALDNNNRVTIRLPLSLKEIYEDETKTTLHRAIKKSRYAAKVVLAGDKLRIDASVMQNLFSNAIQRIVSHVKEIKRDSRIKGISNILMVGGFSESKMLQDAIKSNFPDIKVIVPREAGLIVLKGAVVFGHSPLSIAQRVCKYTYGFESTGDFDPEIHDIRNRSECKEGTICKKLFSKHVEIGQPILLNETTEEISYFPLFEDQTEIEFDIYASTEKSPMYVTDSGCVKLGSVSVYILDNSVPIDKRIILVSMTFGGTEIEVKAREKRTGKTTRATINFLG